MGKWFSVGGWLLAGAAIGYGLAQQERARMQAVQAEREQREAFRQQQALLSLFALLRLRAPLPFLRGYAISPDFALVLMQLIRTHQPTTILELGCGSSTLISAYTLEQYHPAGRLISLEHQAEFAQRTRDHLMTHRLADYATVIHAPLVRQPALNALWYDATSLPPLHPLDMLVIDGPPQYGNPQPMARYPALPLLFSALTPGALIVVDDAARADERQAVARWLREFPLREIDRPETEKGTVILQKL